MAVRRVQVKAGLEQEKAVVLVVPAALSDGRNQLVAITTGWRESTERWAAVPGDLKQRGMNARRLVAAEGDLGIWVTPAQVYPQAQQ